MFRPEDNWLGKAKDYAAVFLAGTGCIFWLLATVLNPQAEIRKDIALIQRDISEIKDDISTFSTKTGEIEKDYKLLSERVTRLER